MASGASSTRSGSEGEIWERICHVDADKELQAAKAVCDELLMPCPNFGESLAQYPLSEFPADAAASMKKLVALALDDNKQNYLEATLYKALAAEVVAEIQADGTVLSRETFLARVREKYHSEAYPVTEHREHLLLEGVKMLDRTCEPQRHDGQCDDDEEEEENEDKVADSGNGEDCDV